MRYFDWYYLLAFLPIVILGYFIAPKKLKPFVLLLASYVYIFLLCGKLLVYIVLATLVIYIIGKWLEKLKAKETEELENIEKERKKEIKELYNKKRKRVLILGIFILVLMLTMTKYLDFISININNILSLFKVNFRVRISNFLAPLGISFYTLSALSYIIDVYRGKVSGNNKLPKLALFLAFFPQITEGPIARYDDIADDLYSGKPLEYKNMCFGAQRIVYGLIKKMVIADRLNPFVTTIFSEYYNYNGAMILLGVILYVVQLYMDFSGVIDIAIGSGEIFGVRMPENFRQPFFSRSISDFWSRWHITLGTWFKDYIFYPISLCKTSRKMTSAFRKKLGNHLGPIIPGSIALLVVWFLNGLWHGAGYNYLFFGMYHFTFIFLGNLFRPLFLNLYQKLKIDINNKFLVVIEVIKTTIIVIFGELFFRASSLSVGFKMFKRIFTDFSFRALNLKNILGLGVDGHDFMIVIVTLIIIFIIGLLKEKKVNIRESIASKPIVVRWIIYYALILFLLIFGAYGIQYAPVDPMYANF